MAGFPSRGLRRFRSGGLLSRQQKDRPRSRSIRSEVRSPERLEPRHVMTASVEIYVSSPGEIAEDGPEWLRYTFTRDGEPADDLTVRYNIAGTAVASDYWGASPGDGSITIARGSYSAEVYIYPVADRETEPDETVILSLVEDAGYALGYQPVAVGKILDDDAPSNLPAVTLAVSPASVTEDGTTNLVYTFTRTGPTTSGLTVNYGVTGTADSTDYTGATPGTGKAITFAAGSATATITVDPTADTTAESDETVILTLATGAGYTIGTVTP